MWVPIDNTYWEYSTTPEVDDPSNADIYEGRHVDGVRVNSDSTENYIYCRKINPPYIGWGELNKSYYDNINSGITYPLYNFFTGEYTYYLAMM